jgi:hypothetical protein
LLYILWAEIILKSAVGLALVVAPSALIALIGMQRPASGFWPRLFGAVLLGVAVGVWIGLKFPSSRGAIGPAGLIPINLFAAAALLGPLILGTSAPTRRGRLAVAGTAALLAALAFLEIAHL